jgi:DNA repair protein RadD
MFTLRNYQRDALDAQHAYWDKGGGNSLIVLPTGSGKSLVMAALCQEVLRDYPKMRIAIATHVKELIAQDYAELMALWPEAPAGIYSAGLRQRDVSAQILFCGIQSVWGKDIGPVDLLIVDESHLIPRSSSTLYQKFITSLWRKTPDMRIVGLTATPYRLDSGRLDEGEDRIFETVVYEAPLRRLIDQKYLCPLISKATSQKLDVSGVGMRGGDFIPGQLEIAIDKDWITKGAVNEIVEYGASRSAWLVFCVGVSHALNVAEEIRSRGVSCETVVGNMPRAERDSLIQQFRAGDLKCLVSVMVLGTGFNVPGVDMICLLRPTMSPGLFVQQVGRGSRNAGGKANCLVLDFAGNTMRHGPVDLITGTKKRGTGDDEAKECPKCHTLVERGIMECPTCGYEWPVPVIKPRVPQHAILADADNAILADPKPKWVAVGHVSYSRHEKFGKPASLRVDYRCGFNVYSQWICFEHQGYPRDKARQWWARNATGVAPLTVAEALGRKHQIQPVDEILIERDGKYFKVIGSHTRELAYE